MDFSREVIAAERPVSLQLIGNSIGGVVFLNAARMLSEGGQPPSQVVLIDCAERELDLKRLPEQPIGAHLSRPLVMVLVRQRWIVSNLFRFFARAGAVRAVLKQAYPSGGNVDAGVFAAALGDQGSSGAMRKSA